MKARRSVISPLLTRWSSEAPASERRTAIVRIAFSSDPDQTAARLADAGAEVQTKGIDTIVCVVTPSSLPTVAADPAVVSVQEATRAFPRGIPSSPAS
jgi:capsular polysaccharide biosynthesis protein